MSAGRGAPPLAGAVLGLLSLFALLAAPFGVMLGGNVFELGVVAIAGVGLSLLHLAVVIGVHGRAIANASRADAGELREALSTRRL